MRRRKTPTIQAGSIADIAFLLLIFFMVTTSLQREKSIAMQLPPKYDGPAGQVNESRVLSLIINADNLIMMEGEMISENVQKHIQSHLSNMVELNKKPYISIKLHENSNYNSYIELLSQVKESIQAIKDEYAMTLYETPFNQLSREQYVALSKKLSIRISESQYIS